MNSIYNQGFFRILYSFKNKIFYKKSSKIYRISIYDYLYIVRKFVRMPVGSARSQNPDGVACVEEAMQAAAGGKRGVGAGDTAICEAADLNFDVDARALH